MAAWASQKLARRSGRRDFLGRTAMVATALAATPKRYVLEPGTAYAAVCRCSGSTCNCGSACCDGYTEFCCTLNGSNTCPAGSVAAGWWKVDASQYCVDNRGRAGPRYYVDCNARSAAPCGSRGVTWRGAGCSCGCALGRCTNRKTCCTAFRYGQCNQQVSCLGPIVCRVVTCTPPWRWEPTCRTTVATDNATRFHHRPCLTSQAPPVVGSLPVAVGGRSWRIGGSYRDHAVADVFTFGRPGDIPVMGDWNGDGVKTPGVVRGRTWYLRDTLRGGPATRVFSFGRPGDIPVVGDWSGNGRDGVGVVRGNVWHLRDSTGGGRADRVFAYGKPGDVPVVGDWTGNGRDGVGVVRGKVWYLRDSTGGGRADRVFAYGRTGDVPVVGDWNRDGRDTPGVVRANTWHLRNSSSSGPASLSFELGRPGDTFLTTNP